MNTSRCAERVCKDTEVLVHDTNQLLKAAGEELKDKASGAGECLAETWRSAGGLCRDAEKEMRKIASEADVVIRRHPYESLAVAFGIGLLGAFLLKKR